VHWPYLRPTLDHVDRLDDMPAEHPRLAVLAIDPHATADRHELALRGRIPRRHERPEDGQDLSHGDLVIAPELDVHIVALGEEHLVGRAADDLTPCVLLAIVEPTDVAQEDRLRRDLRSTQHPKRETSRAAGLIRVAQPYLVAWVNPMRVLDLRVL